jgi:hypothetical protein
MRRRAWLDVLGVLLMAGAAWLVWDARRDGHFQLARDLQDAMPGDDPAARAFGLAPAVTAAAFAVAAVLVLVLARAPRAARGSARVVAGLVVAGAGVLVAHWVSWLSLPDAGPAGPAGTRELVLEYLWPVTVVAGLVTLAACIALPLLRRGAAAADGAAGGAAVVLGAVTAGLLLRDPGRRPELSTLSLGLVVGDGGTETLWLVGGAGLLVAAASLVVVAWCARPAAGREAVLARCRGGYAAVAVLVAEVAARDATTFVVEERLDGGPSDAWLRMHVWLLAGVAVTAAAAGLWRRATPVLAVVVAALGGAVAVANLTRGAYPVWDRFYGPPPWGAAVVVPLVLAVAVAWASRRARPGAEAADEGAPEVAPVG